MRNVPRQIAAFSNYTYRHFFDDGCLYRASALTFTSLLALVPLMVVIFAVMAIFPNFQQLAEQAQDFIFNNFVPDSAQTVKSYLLGFAAQANKLSWVGFAVLLCTAVLMLYTIEQAFNTIWRVPRRKYGLSSFIRYWAILTLSPLLIGVSVAISSYLIALPSVTGAAAVLGIAESLLGLTTYLLSAILFSLLYIVMPNCRVPVGAGILGGLFAALLFELAKAGFTAYILHFSTYQVLYGALAAIPMFLLWVYLVWLITLLGAEVVRALVFRAEYATNKKLDGFTHAFRWLGHLWLAQQQGKALSLFELVKLDRCQYAVAPEKQLACLQRLQFIRRAENGKWLLCCDLSQLTLGKLQQALPWQFVNTVSSEGWEGTLQPYAEQMNTFVEQTMQTSLTSLYRQKISKPKSN